MKKLYHSFLIAFSMYSKIPMPQCEWTEENMAYAMCFFPWVGAVIGGLTWAFGTFGADWGLSPAFYTVILVLIPWLITGGIHLDGLLDTADAMASYQGRERRLEILKDSHTGAFAVITCVVYFMFYYGVYSQASVRVFPVIGLSFMMSRAFSALAIVTFPKAKKTGSVSAMARGSRDRQVQITMGIYLLLIAAVMIWLDRKLGIACCLIALITYGIYYWQSKKHFGGITGVSGRVFSYSVRAFYGLRGSASCLSQAERNPAYEINYWRRFSGEKSICFSEISFKIGRLERWRNL